MRESDRDVSSVRSASLKEKDMKSIRLSTRCSRYKFQVEKHEHQAYIRTYMSHQNGATSFFFFFINI